LYEVVAVGMPDQSKIAEAFADAEAKLQCRRLNVFPSLHNARGVIAYVWIP